jgi:hypothetical protein
MKIISSIIRTVLTLVSILAILFVGTFFLTVFMPSNVMQAIEIFKNFLKIS